MNLPDSETTTARLSMRLPEDSVKKEYDYDDQERCLQQRFLYLSD
jgi:hypothetical protein